MRFARLPGVRYRAPPLPRFLRLLFVSACPETVAQRRRESLAGLPLRVQAKPSLRLAEGKKRAWHAAKRVAAFTRNAFSQGLHPNEFGHGRRLQCGSFFQTAGKPTHTFHLPCPWPFAGPIE